MDEIVDEDCFGEYVLRCSHCRQKLGLTDTRSIAFVCMDCTLDLYTVRTSVDPEDKDPNRSR